MAYCQMTKSTEVKCIDNAFKQPHNNHVYGGKHDNNHTMMTCQTTCQGTTTGSQTHYGSVNPHTHQPNGGYGQYGDATQVHGHGYNGGTAHGYNSGGYTGATTHGGYTGAATHGYNGGAGQVHGYNSHGASQVHGFNGASGVAGMACVGKQHGNGFRRKHRSRGAMAGNDSCSSGSDSESDDECRRHC